MPKTFETSERTKKEFLQTRYYKANADLLLEKLNKEFMEKNINIISYNKSFNELAISTQMYDMTIKAFQYSATETAVDLFIDSRFLFDFNKTKKVINEFYDNLSKQYEFLGKALHR